MMKTTQRKLTRAALLTLVIFLLGLVFNTTALAGSGPAVFEDPLPDLPDSGWAAPDMPTGIEGVLPATTCSIYLTYRACIIWVNPTTLSLPDGSTLPTWGFAPNGWSTPTIPGPTIIANQGEQLLIVLRSTLPEAVGLNFPGHNLVPDMVGVLPNPAWGFGEKRYTFTVDQPGTYIYEAGFTPNGARQTAGGMYGTLIVRPAAPLQAYLDAGSAYTDEAVLVFSEVDVELFNDRTGFELTEYAPEYRLVNGKAYNQVPNIPVTPGSKLLLRLVNAGIEERSVGVLGLNMVQLAMNGSRLPFDYGFFARPMGAGSTMDVLVDIPVDAPVGTKYPVINTAMQQLHNNGALAGDGSVAFGGAITFIEVTGGTAVGDVGPLVSNVSVSPDPASAASTLTLSATLDETTTGGEQVVAAEWFTETAGTPGTGFPFTFVPGVSVVVSTTIPSSTLTTWPAGDVTFYVRGQDADGTWGPVGSTVLDLVKAGPVIRGLSTTPAVTNGSKAVVFRGTADDTATGSVNVTAVEYFLDATGANGTGLPVSQNKVAPIVGISGIVPTSTLQTLAEGAHVLYIHGVDELNNWGAFTPITFTVDLTGPTATGVDVRPNPNNGRQQLNSSMYVMRARASLLDSAKITKAEGFFDAPGATGTGFAWIPADGLYNGASESIYVDIPLTTVAQFAEGPHTIYVHGQDEAGNWGAFATLEFVIDKTGPAISAPTVSPNPTNGAALVALGGIATDPVNGAAPGSNIVAAEWFEGFDPGMGWGTPLLALDGSFDSASEVLAATINVSGWTNGDHVLSMRAKDAAGNWGAVVQVTLTVSGNLMNHVLMDDFESGNLMSAWNYATADVYNSYSAALDGSKGLRIMLRNGQPSFLVDRTPTSEASYRASFLINAASLDTKGDALGFLTGESASEEALFGLEYARNSSGGQLRAWVLSGGQRSYTGWSSLTDGVQKVELVWEASGNANVYLMVNGVSVSAIRGIDTSAYRLETVKLGAREAYSTSLFGSLFFDNFESYRQLPAAPQFKVFMPSVVSKVTP